MHKGKTNHIFWSNKIMNFSICFKFVISKVIRPRLTLNTYDIILVYTVVYPKMKKKKLNSREKWKHSQTNHHKFKQNEKKNSTDVPKFYLFFEFFPT